MILLCHIFALLALLLLPVIFYAQMMAIVILILSFIYIFYKYYSEPLLQIENAEGNAIVIFKLKNITIQGKVLSSSVVTEFYICAHCLCKETKKRYYFVLMRDSFSSNDQYRLFSAWLKQIVT